MEDSAATTTVATDVPAGDPGAALEAEVARMIVETLQLEIAPEAIAPDEPLFGEGLGLDSIDALEIALAVSRRFGVSIRSENDRTAAVFGSLRRLAGFIAAHRPGA